jgi:hypothetical protein
VGVAYDRGVVSVFEEGRSEQELSTHSPTSSIPWHLISLFESDSKETQFSSFKHTVQCCCAFDVLFCFVVWNFNMSCGIGRISSGIRVGNSKSRVECVGGGRMVRGKRRALSL